jgi:hypothetical protein
VRASLKKTAWVLGAAALVCAASRILRRGGEPPPGAADLKSTAAPGEAGRLDPEAPISPLAERVLAVAQRSKYEVSLEERIAELAALGPSALPALRQLVQGGQGPAAVLITALGFLATEDDKASVEQLGAIAFGEREAFRREALQGLLRMGGAAARRVVDRLLIEQDEALREDIAAVIWQLREVEDLEYARSALARFAAAHPDSSFAQTLRASTLARLDTAIAVGKARGAPRSLEQLTAILRKEDVHFVTVPAGLAEMWALEQLARAGGPGAVAAIRSFLREVVEGSRTIGPQVRVLALKALDRLGEPLSDDERTWLRENRGSVGVLLLTWNSADLVKLKSELEPQLPNERKKEG